MFSPSMGAINKLIPIFTPSKYKLHLMTISEEEQQNNSSKHVHVYTERITKYKEQLCNNENRIINLEPNSTTRAY